MSSELALSLVLGQAEMDAETLCSVLAASRSARQAAQHAWLRVQLRRRLVDRVSASLAPWLGAWGHSLTTLELELPQHGGRAEVPIAASLGAARQLRVLVLTGACGATTGRLLQALPCPGQLATLQLCLSDSSWPPPASLRALQGGLAALTGLAELSLTSVSRQCGMLQLLLPSLSGMTGLTRLCLDSTYSRANLHYLPASLVELTAGFPERTGIELRPLQLSHLPALEVLDTTSSGVGAGTDGHEQQRQRRGLLLLACDELPASLRVARLAGCPFVAPLQRLPQLTELALASGSSTTGARSLQQLGCLLALPRLRSLAVRGLQLGDAWPAAGGAQQARLESLRLPDCGLGDAAVHALAASQPALRELDLSSNKRVTRAGVVAAAGLRCLSQLALTGTSAGDEEPAGGSRPAEQLLPDQSASRSSRGSCDSCESCGTEVLM